MLMEAHLRRAALSWLPPRYDSLLRQVEDDANADAPYDMSAHRLMPRRLTLHV